MTHPNRITNEGYFEGDMPDLRDSFRDSKMIGGLVGHIGLAFATGGISLPVTLAGSAVDFFAGKGTKNVFGDTLAESGNEVQARHQTDDLVGENRYIAHAKTIANGALTGAWQAGTQAIAYSGVALATLADGVKHIAGYLGDKMQGSDQTLTESLDNYKPTYMNTVRDAFARVRMLAPNENDSRSVEQHSLLNQDNAAPAPAAYTP